MMQSKRQQLSTESQSLYHSQDNIEKHRDEHAVSSQDNMAKHGQISCIFRGQCRKMRPNIIYR